jgi:hypothetical protein
LQKKIYLTKNVHYMQIFDAYRLALKHYRFTTRELEE